MKLTRREQGIIRRLRLIEADLTTDTENDTFEDIRSFKDADKLARKNPSRYLRWRVFQTKLARRVSLN
jgi:hypothetical protein